MRRLAGTLVVLATLSLSASAAASTSLTGVGQVAARYAAQTKHYSTFKETRPVCAWIQRPKPPNYMIMAAIPGDTQLALCKLMITERFQLIDPDTGKVAGYSDPTQYPLFVSIAEGRPAVYHGGPIG